MLTITRFAAAFVRIMSVGLHPAHACTCSCCRPSAPASKPMHDHGAGPGRAAKATQVKLVVSGMSCAACAARVQNALTSVSGVLQAQVDLGKRQAVVAVEADKLDEQALVKAVETAGYAAKVLK